MGEIPSTIGWQLTEMGKDKDGEPVPKGVVSRGGHVEMYGQPTQYVGYTPDGLAHFYVGPGDIRALDAEQLANQSYAIVEFNDKRVGRGKKT